MAKPGRPSVLQKNLHQNFESENICHKLASLNSHFMDGLIKFYHDEWMNAEKDGNTLLAKGCKERYRELVMEKLTKPYHFYIESLKRYPMINLN